MATCPAAPSHVPLPESRAAGPAKSLCLAGVRAAVRSPAHSSAVQQNEPRPRHHHLSHPHASGKCKPLQEKPEAPPTQGCLPAPAAPSLAGEHPGPLWASRHPLKPHTQGPCRPQSSGDGGLTQEPPHSALGSASLWTPTLARELPPEPCPCHPQGTELQQIHF